MPPKTWTHPRPVRVPGATLRLLLSKFPQSYNANKGFLYLGCLSLLHLHFSINLDCSNNSSQGKMKRGMPRQKQCLTQPQLLFPQDRFTKIKAKQSLQIRKWQSLQLPPIEQLSRRTTLLPQGGQLPPVKQHSSKARVA